MSDTILRQHADPGWIAVVRETIPWNELSRRLRPMFDAVYVAVRAGRLVPHGHNVVVYRQIRPDRAAVEAGIQVAGSFADFDRIHCSQTPGGPVASVEHIGPYHLLSATHQAVIRWCADQGATPAGIQWEIYGDWDDDPARLRTRVFHLLAE
ncbi:hypothetical protein LBMAG53_39890 [Planctomycetota bacterium]|nr:hypothetical protein LBMAG53_39890 [Planctomycetota bacterium]